jgi:hypothetical protein
MYVCMYVCIMPIRVSILLLYILLVSLWNCVCVYISRYIQIIHIYMHACIHARMHACTHAHACIHTHITFYLFFGATSFAEHPSCTYMITYYVHVCIFALIWYTCAHVYIYIHTDTRIYIYDIRLSTASHRVFLTNIHTCTCMISHSCWPVHLRCKHIRWRADSVKKLKVHSPNA